MTIENILDELEEFSTDDSYSPDTRVAALAAMLLHYELDRIARALERMAGPVDGLDNSIAQAIRDTAPGGMP